MRLYPIVHLLPLWCNVCPIKLQNASLLTCNFACNHVIRLHSVPLWYSIIKPF